MNQTIYVIIGLAFAALAVTVTLVGMRFKSFPNRPTYAALFLLFIALAVCTATFAVRYSVDEQHHREESATKGQDADESAADSALARPLAPVVSQRAF